jgi:hypothetical protein
MESGKPHRKGTKLLNITLDVTIMAVIVASFLWGGYGPKTEPVGVKPAQSSSP